MNEAQRAYDHHGGADPSGYRHIAALYEAARPGYPDDLVDRLVRLVGVGSGSAVAEVGAGTGHFTRRLATRRLAVTAVEPVAEMRAAAPPLAGVRWVPGTFAATGLPDGSQAWVVAAQSFHWATPAAALPEMRRILATGGWLTVVWNAHRITADPIVSWTYAALRRFVPAYHYVDRSTAARRLSSHLLGAAPDALQRWLFRWSACLGDPVRLSRGLALRTSADFGRVHYLESRHRVRVSAEGYVDLWRSRNRLREIAGTDAFAAFIQALRGRLASERVETVDVPYVCGSWSARRTDSQRR